MNSRAFLVLVVGLAGCAEQSSAGGSALASVGGDAHSGASVDTAAPADTATGAPSDTGSPTAEDVSSAADVASEDVGTPDVGPPADAADPSDASGLPPGVSVVLDVGPDQEYADPGEVPWEAIGPGTLVRIHWRPEPYANKWVINVPATQDAPVIVEGVPNEAGELPVISGDGATTRQALDYWNDERSVIKIGGSSVPSPDGPPSHITLSRLAVRSAHPGYSFSDDKGQPAAFAKNAAAVHVELGHAITISECELSDSGNGLFVSYDVTKLVVRANFVHGNGIEGSAFEHNSYSNGVDVVFELNRYGPLRPGADGNNLKDRSALTVIRYNWIAGGNRQLDLVDGGHDAVLDHPAYGTALVYGNVLIEPAGAGNSQIVHYGGDGDDPTHYRNGTLQLYHNTIISRRKSPTTLVRLSNAAQSADIRNNVVWTTEGAALLAITAGSGAVELRTNWLSGGWKPTHQMALEGVVDDLGGNLLGESPGLHDPESNDFRPAPGSPLLGAAGLPADAALDHPITLEYVPHQASAPRPDASDLGALTP